MTKQAPMRPLLRFMTCGSVDDGKSTLIGRLLVDAGGLYEDQVATDLAHVTDGLQAEREQGITIDVAYRYFSTANRQFIIADTPGHEQYTRNMATAASHSDVAVILLDARHGVRAQTRRHSFIVALLGIRQVIVAINKMDAFDFDQAHYKKLQQDYLQVAAQLELTDVRFVPISALHGDNVVHKSTRTPWFRGQSLLQYLEQAEPQRPQDLDLRFPVQLVLRPDQDFRGYAGTLASGTLQRGDTVRVMASGMVSSVAGLWCGEQPLQQASAGDAITLTLHDELDISRGDLLVAARALALQSDRLRARVVWMANQPLQLDGDFLLKCGSQQVKAWPLQIHHRIAIDSFAEQPARALQLNEIGLVDFALQRPIAFDRYRKNRTTGSFILIDRHSHATVAAGLIEDALSLATDRQQPAAAGQALPAAQLFYEAALISSQQRAVQKQQQARVIWLTGLSGSGKSTIAKALDQALFAQGKHSFLLDGDNLRQGLNSDLSFRQADRSENIRRLAEVAKLMADAGLLVIVAAISPFRQDRQQAQQIIGPERFIEVFVDTPLATCEQRDVKGLYARARRGELAQFTGISSPYEPPTQASLTLATERLTIEQAVEQILRLL